jgi:hypothetical protein
MNSGETATHCCEEMARHLAEGEVAITYSPRFREYGIKILDGGSATQLITYCPWCGGKLPSSLRDEWFEIVEGLGLEAGDPQIPEEMSSAAWWQRRGL